MTREKMLKDIYNFYSKITNHKLLRTFEHYKSMSSTKTDQEVADQWLVVKQFEAKNKK